MKAVAAALTLSLLSGCASEMETAAHQDRQAFLQCKQANPETWGDKCTGELNLYQTTASAAEAESQHRAAQAQAVASGLLAGLVVGAAAVAAAQPVYVAPVPVYAVPYYRW